jgi:DNA-binding winged helix-turn-helix (wHTH) protein
LGVLTVFDSSAPALRLADRFALEFLPSSTIRMEDREQHVGEIVYRLLQALFDAPARELPLDELQLRVWGRKVSRNTLWSACRRGRSALIKLEHPLRVALDGDRIALV